MDVALPTPRCFHFASCGGASWAAVLPQRREQFHANSVNFEGVGPRRLEACQGEPSVASGAEHSHSDANMHCGWDEINATCKQTLSMCSMCLLWFVILYHACCCVLLCVHGCMYVFGTCPLRSRRGGAAALFCVVLCCVCVIFMIHLIYLYIYMLHRQDQG